MLNKIISGGQVGVDIAALRAAKQVGLLTGGYMPLGFRQVGGSMHREDIDFFCMQELETTEYPPRTFRNVKESDATLRVAHDFSTRGEKCTMKAIVKYGKPVFDVPMLLDDKEFSLTFASDPEKIHQWLMKNHIRVLNVAGNAIPNFEPFIEDWLIDVMSYHLKLTGVR